MPELGQDVSCGWAQQPCDISGGDFVVDVDSPVVNYTRVVDT